MKKLLIRVLVKVILLWGCSVQAATFVYFESDFNSIGRGDTDTVNFISEIITRDDSFFYVDFVSRDPLNVNSSVRYGASFTAPKGESLVPGIYSDAERFASAVTPGIDANGYYGCNAGMGTYTVLEADFVQSIYAIDYEYTCINGGVPEAGSFRGVIRINSDIPQIHNLLFAHAGREQFRKEGELVTLSGASSQSGSNTIVSYDWLQLSGTTVVLSNTAESSDVEFTLPKVEGMQEDLVFELTVTNNLGQTDSQTVTIHATNQGGPQSYIRFYNGSTVVKEYTLNDGVFAASCLSTTGLGDGSYIIGLVNCNSADQLQFNFDGKGSTRIDFAVQSPFVRFHEIATGYCVSSSGASIEVFSMLRHSLDVTSASVVAADIIENCTSSRLDDGAAYTKIEYRLNTLYPQPDPKPSGSSSSSGTMNWVLLVLLSMFLLSVRVYRIK